MRKLYPFIEMCDEEKFSPIRHNSARLHRFHPLQSSQERIRPSSITIKLKLKPKPKGDTSIPNISQPRSKKLLTMLKYQKVKVNKIKKDNSRYDHQYLRKEKAQKVSNVNNVDFKTYLKTSLAKLNQSAISNHQLQGYNHKDSRSRIQRVEQKEKRQGVGFNRNCSSLSEAGFKEAVRVRCSSDRGSELLSRIKAITFEKLERPKQRRGDQSPGSLSKADDEIIKGWD